MALTKTNTQNDTKHAEYYDATDIKNIIFVYFGFFFFIYKFLKNLSKKCSFTALVRSMTIIGSLNQFLAISNFTRSQHLLVKKRPHKICRVTRSTHIIS